MPPGRLTAIPSAIVSADAASIGSPAAIDSGNGAHAAAWTPTICTDGLASLIASATPAASPPPPTGITTFARSGTSSSSSSPSEPWPATIAGSSNGCTKASPPLSARSSATITHASTLLPPMWTIAPCSRAASTFAIGASAGTKTSHGMPRAAAAAASACAWLPAEAATTPRAQPSSPSVASLLATPRTLKDPVRWRFSAFSATVPPARSENVRVDSIGVRRATVWTAARAARTSLAVTLMSAMTASISTSAPIGSAATPIVVREGGSDGK